VLPLEGFWIVTSCSVVGHQSFGGPCCIHLKMKEARRPGLEYSPP